MDTERFVRIELILKKLSFRLFVFELITPANVNYFIIIQQWIWLYIVFDKGLG